MSSDPLRAAVSGALTASRGPIEILGMPAGSARLGTCPACASPVLDSTSSVLYRGDYYHGARCTQGRQPARKPPVPPLRAALAALGAPLRLRRRLRPPAP